MRIFHVGTVVPNRKGGVGLWDLDHEILDRDGEGESQYGARNTTVCVSSHNSNSRKYGKHSDVVA